jgi:Skp family chaperone for outer membrane proteins
MKKILNALLVSLVFFNIATAQAMPASFASFSFGGLFYDVYAKTAQLITLKVQQIYFGNNTSQGPNTDLYSEKKELDDLQKIVDSKKEEVKKLADLKSQLQDCSKMTGTAFNNCNDKKIEKGILTETPVPANVSGAEGVFTEGHIQSPNSMVPFGSGYNGNQVVSGTVQDNTAYYSQVGVSEFAPAGCGMQKGPIGYNIGTKNNGLSTPKNILNVVIGHHTKDTQNTTSGLQAEKRYAAGYMTPLLAKYDTESLSKYSRNSSDANDGYGSRKFNNYNSNEFKEFFEKQLEHWRLNVNTKSQCIVVDIDNCDSIGWPNYKNVLNLVQESNNKGGPKVMVFTKNPQACGGVEAFKHPVVVGAFTEEMSPVERAKLFAERKIAGVENKPILMAAGSGSNNSKGRLTNLQQNCNASKDQKNVFASFDSGEEYFQITKAVSCGQ